MRVGVADCVCLHCAGSGAVAGDDDSFGGGEGGVLHGGDCAGVAGEDKPERSGVCGDGSHVGGVVCGGVCEDEKFDELRRMSKPGLGVNPRVGICACPEEVD